MKRPSDALKIVRNSVRPFFGKNDKKAYYKNIDTVRGIINTSNAHGVLSIVESNKHYPFPGLGNTFPDNPKNIPLTSLNRLQYSNADKEILIQTSRINYHSSVLSRSLESLSNINALLSKGEYIPEVSRLISDHIAKYGWSFVILRKFMLSKLMESGLPGLSSVAQDITTKYDRRVWGIYCHFLYDLMDPSYDPFSALMVWKDQFRTKGESAEWYTLLFSDLMDVSGNIHNQNFKTLMRFSNSSLLDLTLYAWKRFGYIYENKHNIGLSSDIHHQLDEKFNTIIITPPKIYSNGEKTISDLELYRSALLFDDVRDVSNWRAEFNSLMICSTEDTNSISHVNNVFAALRNSDLRPADISSISNNQLNWEKQYFDLQGFDLDQYLMKATILSFSLRNNPVALLTNRNELAELIAKTVNFHEFVSETTLTKLISRIETKDVLDFIVRDLLFKKIRSRDNDLERRLVFMKLIQNSGEHTITAYIYKLSLMHPAIARHMASICTRTFLERLFLLMSSIRDVISTRIEICEWLARDGDETESISEEIASLRRELANLDTRSDLDSTRIHVDEESLRDWFWETQKPSVNRLIQTVIAEGKGNGNFSLLRFLGSKDKSTSADEVKIESQLGSEHLLLAIFSATLNAFASDKSFGLDAYLSRRIRHGTLSGSIITPLSRIIKRYEDYSQSDIPEDIDPSQDFPSLILHWRKALAAHLDDARKHIIQLELNSERGIIRADWRTASNIAHVDAAISRIKARIIESKGVYDIFPDLYALCWDCIEPDLAQLRRYLLRDLLPTTAAPLATIWSGLNTRNQLSARGVIYQLHSTLQNKIHEVCGWFIRPVFRRDSYSLKMLVTSTLSIVRELDENYSFEEQVSISEQLTLNRASFDVFGDLLFVVLGNAAKYGARGSKINVSSESSQSTGGDVVIAVQVQSFVDNAEDFDVAITRIETAMNIQATEIAKAAVGEGFSGLGKAVGIMRHVKSETAALVFDADREKLDIRFAIYLPSQIAVNRTQ